MSENPPTSPVTRWVRRRLALLWSGARVGLAVGGALTLLVALGTGDRVGATSTAVAAGSFALGLALLAWGLATLFGEALDGTGRVPAEATVRRVATRVAGGGVGVVVGATVVSVLVALA